MQGPQVAEPSLPPRLSSRLSATRAWLFPLHPALWPWPLLCPCHPLAIVLLMFSGKQQGLCVGSRSKRCVSSAGVREGV